MKKNLFKKISFYALFFSLLYPQVIFADLPLKRDDLNPGTVILGAERTTTLKTYSKTTVETLPVSADIINGELGIFFDYPVGITYVTVTDVNGNIVAFETVDTYTASELYIPIENLVSGHYTLRISYGTTKLIGEFQL
jgi:hypothetical protein